MYTQVPVPPYRHRYRYRYLVPGTRYRYCFRVRREAHEQWMGRKGRRQTFVTRRGAEKRGQLEIELFIHF